MQQLSSVSLKLLDNKTLSYKALALLSARAYKGLHKIPLPYYLSIRNTKK